jgi:hypothetical protein
MPHRCFAEGIIRNAADHRCLVAEASQRDSHVALRAADADVEMTALKKQFPAWGRQAKQEFAEADDLHAASA